MRSFAVETREASSCTRASWASRRLVNWVGEGPSRLDGRCLRTNANGAPRCVVLGWVDNGWQACAAKTREAPSRTRASWASWRLEGCGAMMMACCGWCGLARRGRRRAVEGHGRGLRGVGGREGTSRLVLALVPALALALRTGNGGDILGAHGLSSKTRRLGGRSW